MDPTLKRLIDEHANDDLSSAPDESDILDAALDLEQSFSQRGLVQGQSSVPVYSSQLPRLDRQRKDVRGTVSTERSEGVDSSSERVPAGSREELNDERGESPDDSPRGDSDSEVPHSPEAAGSQESTPLVEDDEDDDRGVKESPSKNRHKSRVLEVSDEDEEGGEEIMSPGKDAEKETDGVDGVDDDDENKPVANQ